MSALIAANNQPQRMSSRMIAEIMGKNHADMCRDIRTMLSKLYGGSSAEYVRKADLLYATNQGVDNVKFGDSPNAWEFELDRRHTEILITGYDVVRRAAVIDRWFELEAQRPTNTLQLPDFTDPAAAAIAWAEQFREKQSLAGDVSRLQNTCNRLADQFAIGLTPPQFAAQLNGVNTQKVNDFLFKMGWVYKEADEWRVAAYARDKYLKQEFLNKPIREGITRLCSKLTLTRRGAKQFYKYYTDQKLPMKTTWDGNLTHITFEKVA